MYYNYTSTVVGRTASIMNDTEEHDHETEEEEEKTKIRKGVAFWNHPGLHNIPTEEKRSYLKERQGLTDSQIHQVWEGIANNSSNTTSSNNNNKDIDDVLALDNDIKNNNDRSLTMNHPQYKTNGNGNGNGNGNEHRNSSTPPLYYDSNQNQNHNQSHNYNHYHPEYKHHEQPSHYSQRYNNNNNNIHQQHELLMNTNNRVLLPLSAEDEDAEEPIAVIARGMSCIAVGGFLGLTGAAAIRWLNGGDFELFPRPQLRHRSSCTSPSSTSTSSAVLSSSLPPESTTMEGDENVNTNGCDNKNNARCLNNNDDTDEYYDHDDDNCDDKYVDDDDDNEYIEQCLIERMENLLESIDSNSALQERLIHKLANSSTITDQSMNLLKKNDMLVKHQQQQKQQHQQESKKNLDTHLLELELSEIKDGFTKLLSANNTNRNENSNKDDDVNNINKHDDCSIINVNNNNDNDNSDSCKERLDYLQKNSGNLINKLDNCIKSIKKINQEQQKEEDVGRRSSINAVTTTTTDDNSLPSRTTTSTEAAIIHVAATAEPTLFSSFPKKFREEIPTQSEPDTATATATTATAIATTTTIANNNDIETLCSSIAIAKSNDDSTATATIVPVSLKDCINTILENNDANVIKSGSQLLYLYLTNISTKPNNERYRKIYKSNESFRKVESMIGGTDLLQIVGFVENGDNSNILEWVPNMERNNSPTASKTGTKQQGGEEGEEELSSSSSLTLVMEALNALGTIKTGKFLSN